MTKTETSTNGIERGDRVEVQLHGATTRNDAKGTVVDESPVSVLSDAVLIQLDNSYQNCDNPYETSRSSVTKIGNRPVDGEMSHNDGEGDE